MPTTIESAAAAANRTASDPIERRRPGRAETVNPRLVPLLRRQSAYQPSAAPAAPASDAVGDAQTEKPGLPPLAIRGIAIGVLVAVPVWVAIGFGIAWILRSH